MSLREGDLKLVYHFGFRPTQVFNLAQDPFELENIADTLEPAELLRLEHELLARLQAVDEFWAANDAEILNAEQGAGN